MDSSQIWGAWLTFQRFDFHHVNMGHRSRHVCQVVMAPSVWRSRTEEIRPLCQLVGRSGQAEEFQLCVRLNILYWTRMMCFILRYVYHKIHVHEGIHSPRVFGFDCINSWVELSWDAGISWTGMEPLGNKSRIHLMKNLALWRMGIDILEFNDGVWLDGATFHLLVHE